MSAPATQRALFRHNNQRLFSNHYLDERVVHHPVWKRWEYEDGYLRGLMRGLRDIWAGLEPSKMNESQTERDWIWKVLSSSLGHHFEIEVPLETPRGTHYPDYIFVSTAEDRKALRGTISEEDLTGALAVGDAKRWDRDLDAKSVDDQKALSSVPPQQIDFYLTYTGLQWGILTNGRKWRLYHCDSSHKFDVFYEVDLPQLLEQGDVEAFKYFYLFFRREAFEGTPSFLEEVLEQSRAYQHGVSEDLEKQVYDALLSISKGFFEIDSNCLHPDEKTLKSVHDASLIVLYRLLFVFFAESRGLLPRSGQYQFYSLRKWAGEIAESGVDNMGGAGGTVGWAKLRDQWRFIDRGSEDMGIPPYNGGLFNAADHPFLEEYRVGDRRLAKAVDLLARATNPQTGRREFVDYRDLDVRHLGSIYEGLLEYKLRRAEAALRVGSSGTYTTVEERGEADVASGELYLATDKGERKATGSYYTPHYIVEYIVERTVGPVLEELRSDHLDDEDNLVDQEQLVEKVLDVNVLDPAMGSGHFLVEVIDYIARFLVEVAPPTGDNGSAETELAYWRRRVAQACVYGVDVNPLAVELAKLSLWLRTVAKDKPLSFLDHHLRCGNSLFGARVEDLPLKREQSKHFRAKERRQPNFFDTDVFQQAMESARGLMDQIEGIAGETLDEVREAAHLYERLVEEHTKRPRRLADAITAVEFGLDVDAKFFDEFVDRLRNDTWRRAPEYVALVDEITDIAEEHRFFHWELEFPEVFFEKYGEVAGEEGGFDVVVGNPPYGATLGERERRYVEASFQRQQYQLDTYLIFVEQGLRLLREGGFWGMIIPNTWAINIYCEDIRRLVLMESQVTHLVQHRHDVFPGVTVDTQNLILAKLPLDAAHEVVVAESWSPERSDTWQHQQRYWGIYDGAPVNLLLRGPAARLCQRLSRLTPLGELANITQGCKPFQVGKGNPAQTRQIVEEKPFVSVAQQDETFRPLLRGSLIGRYELKWRDEYFISFGDWLAEPRYSANYDAAEKVVVRQTGDSLVSVVDDRQFIVRDNLYSIVPVEGSHVNCWALCGIINSTLLTWYYQNEINPEVGEALAQVKRDHLARLPMPLDVRETGQTSISQVENASRKLHRLWSKWHEVKTGLNPFKWLDRNVEVTKFGDAFQEEIKYAELVYDLGRVRHDIDGLLLEKGRSDWRLRVLLKQRNEETGWRDWVKNGREIAREWVTVYRFNNLSNAKGVYYQQAFEVLDEFGHTGSFPGGKTRTTKKKLDLTKIPIFDQNIELDGLVELAEEFREIEQQIHETDSLIDQLIYSLYGLTEEEIATVEGSF